MVDAPSFTESPFGVEADCACFAAVPPNSPPPLVGALAPPVPKLLLKAEEGALVVENGVLCSSPNMPVGLGTALFPKRPPLPLLLLPPIGGTGEGADAKEKPEVSGFWLGEGEAADLPSVLAPARLANGFAAGVTEGNKVVDS